MSWKPKHRGGRVPRKMKKRRARAHRRFMRQLPFFAAGVVLTMVRRLMQARKFGINTVTR